MRVLRMLPGIAIHKEFLLLCCKEDLLANLYFIITVGRGKKADQVPGSSWNLLVSVDRVIWSAD